MGHRAAPLGSAEAMASKAASVRAMRIISGHLIPAERYFHGATQSPLRAVADAEPGVWRLAEAPSGVCVHLQLEHRFKKIFINVW